MEPWIDTHFVKVQDLPKSGSNKVTFRGRTFSEPGFLSYSAAQSAEVCTEIFSPSVFLIPCS